MSAQLSTRAQQADELLPIVDASQRLKISPWTLKRMHAKGNLPAVIANSRWFVPESFVVMVLGSPRPGRAGLIEEVAAAWFAAHAPEAVAS